jgi:hypothetical protein
MKTKLKIIVQSHLSDALAEISIQPGNTDTVIRIKFVKWLLSRYTDTTTEIDPDAAYKLFIEKYL